MTEYPRMRFATERTLLAWVWTGLALMGFGFVMARFGLFLRELPYAPPVRSDTWSAVSGVALRVEVAVKVLAAAK